VGCFSGGEVIRMDSQVEKPVKIIDGFRTVVEFDNALVLYLK
jgi:hypothetical protein